MTGLGGVARCLVALAGLWGGPALAANDWVIGQVAAFSGLRAQIGNDLRSGAVIALNAANARGGVAGRTLRLVTRDDSPSGEGGLAAVRALLDQDKPVALFGFSNHDTTVAVLQSGLLDAQKLPLVGPRTGAARVLSAASGQVFVTRAGHADEIGALMQHAAVSGVRDVAVIYQKDEQGAELLAAAESHASRHKLRLVARQPCTPEAAAADQVRTLPNVSAVVDAVQRVPHQAVLFAVTDPALAASLVATFARGPVPGVMMTLSSADGAWLADRVGGDRARGLWLTSTVPAPRNAAVPVVRRFLADLKAGGASDEDIAGMLITSVMLEGYISMQVLIEGLRRAGPGADPARLTAALQAMRGFDLGGYEISFGGPGRSGARFVEVGIVGRQGQLIR